MPAPMFAALGVIPLLGDAEAAGEIVWTNEDGIETGHGEDFVECVHGRDAFDVYDEEAVGSALLHVGGEFGLGCGAIEHLLETLAFDGAEFHGTAQSLDLIDRFHIGGDDACGTAIEDHGGGVGIGCGNAHERR
jgi:hypothetical protein